MGSVQSCAREYMYGHMYDIRYIVMACIVMAFMVVAYLVMAYIVMAY